MIYFDMDGVLCQWDPTSSVEDTFQPGYFLSRKEEKGVSKLIRQLKKEGHAVAILSAVYTEGTAYAEKEQWLKDHGLGDITKIFVPYGDDKNKYVGPGDNILVDDFSRNLHAWEKAGYTGVKFYNGINGTHGTWTGYSINRRMPLEKMLTIIRAVAQATKKHKS